MAIGVFIILFAVVFYVISKFLNNSGASLVISLAISAMASWKLYNERFYGWEASLSSSTLVVVIALFIIMIWAFLRFVKSGAGKYKKF